MPRPKQNDLPAMQGPGVALPRYKDLDKLADEFIEVRDEKATLAEKLGKLEEKIVDKMVSHSLSRYRFSDQEIVLKPSSTHIKIKAVRVEGVETPELGGEE